MGKKNERDDVDVATNGNYLWAKEHVLDPLTEPEPHQLCGPGSSFITPDGIQRSLSVQTKPTRTRDSRNRDKALPTPPTLSSPTKSRFRPKLGHSKTSTPAVSDTSKRGYIPIDEDEDGEHAKDVERLLTTLTRSLSVTEGYKKSTYKNRRDLPPSAGLNRSKTVHTAYPRETRWNQGTILTRKDSVASASTRYRPETPNSQNGPRSSGSIVASPVASPLSSPIASPMSSPVAMNMDQDKGKGLRRSGSLSARYPGDMSHRPLDAIKQDQRAAMRAPHLHNPRHKQPADLVDTLDQSGVVDVPYHHEGPYDATLASRNRKKLYSPLDAVKDSNEEAIKATPREYIQDSLSKHVPLQGTAVIPPGQRDLSGRTMEYEEGADLMRESDAPGGAYKRYEGIVSATKPTTSAQKVTAYTYPNRPPTTTHCYTDCPGTCPGTVPWANKKLPDEQRYRDGDLKGKGEPSYTIERDRKEEKARLRKHAGMGEGGGSQLYEMQPQRAGANGYGSGVASRKDHGAQVRQRSVSNAAETTATAGPSNPLMRHDSREGYATNNDLRRRNTTGNKFTEGLKRRFGSLRKKKPSGDY